MEIEDFTDIQMTFQDLVARIVINRPDKFNAIRIRTYRELIAALKLADASPDCRVIQIEGAEGQFTAGNDLADLIGGDMKDLGECVQGIFTTLANVKKVVVAAVEGVAVGIVTTLLLHCDVVVASSKTRFRVPFVNLGVVPEGGSSILMPQIFGQKAARDILLTGRFFSADEALSWGLITAIAAPGEVTIAVQGYINSLLQQPFTSLVKTKELMRESLPDVETLVARELESFVSQLNSSETRERIAGLVKKQ